MSLIQFLRAVIEKKTEKTSNLHPFWGYVPDLRGYLGHEFGMPGCPIAIRRYMPNFIKILRAVFAKLEVLQKVGIGKKTNSSQQ